MATERKEFLKEYARALQDNHAAMFVGAGLAVGALVAGEAGDAADDAAGAAGVIAAGALGVVAGAFGLAAGPALV